MRKSWWSGGAAVAVLSATLLTACDPLPPPVTFTVTTTEDGSDATPGDGVCEVTAGEGDCTVRAGIEEAGALVAPGGVVIDVPEGSYVVDSAEPVKITARGLRLRGAGAFDTRLRIEGFVVPAGTALTLEDMDLTAGPASTGPPGATVGGSLILRRVSLLSLSGIVVDATGTLVIKDANVGGGLSSVVITNAGTAVLDHVTMRAVLAPSAVHTTETGTTHLRSTTLISPGGPRWPPGFGTACTGSQPVSHGYNTAWGTSCELAGPGDQIDVNPIDAASSALLVDAIPVGTAGCGDPGDVDLVGTVRPVDGDGDGVAACDIGAEELLAP